MHQAHDRQARFKPAPEGALGDVGRGSAHGFASLEWRRARADGRANASEDQPIFTLVSLRKAYSGTGEIGRRRPLTDAAGGVVDRAVARALPAVVLAFVAERHAAEMRADAADDQPLRLLDPLLVGLRILELGERRVHRVVDLLLGAVADEHRAAAPFDRDDLPFGDRRQSRPRSRRARASRRRDSSDRSAAKRRRRRRPRRPPPVAM